MTKAPSARGAFKGLGQGFLSSSKTRQKGLGDSRSADSSSSTPSACSSGAPLLEPPPVVTSEEEKRRLMLAAADLQWQVADEVRGFARDAAAKAKADAKPR